MPVITVELVNREKEALKKKAAESLGISLSSSETEIKKAYRKLAMQYHPDKQAKKTPQEKIDAEAKFKEIAEAYQLLTDDEALMHKAEELAMSKAQQAQAAQHTATPRPVPQQRPMPQKKTHDQWEQRSGASSQQYRPQAARKNNRPSHNPNHYFRREQPVRSEPSLKYNPQEIFMAMLLMQIMMRQYLYQQQLMQQMMMYQMMHQSMYVENHRPTHRIFLMV